MNELIVFVAGMAFGALCSFVGFFIGWAIDAVNDAEKAKGAT